MSQSEFDQYLALLSGLLRLSAAQREAIASELRDHLEERLAELLAEGVSRHKAIERALEEFGDATGLASEFVQIFRQQRRRWMMRMTLGTAAGLAAMVLLTFAFWPQDPPGRSLNPVVAQDDTESRPGDAERLAPTLDDADRKADAELRKRIDFEFIEITLDEVLDNLAYQVDLQFHIKTRHLEDIGLSSDAPVSLSLKHVSVEMGLDLILEQLDLTYIIRDGVILVTTEEDLDNVEEVRVYNCRDLLGTDDSLTSEYMDDVAEDGSGDVSSTDEVPANEKAKKNRKKRPAPKAADDAPANKQSSIAVVPRSVLAQFGGGQGGGGYGGGGMPAEAQGPYSREEQLMDIIMTAVVPDSWEPVGGPGTIAEFDGLIVIRHNPRIHRQVEQVLKMLREASGQQSWTKTSTKRRRSVSHGGGGGGGGGGFF